MFGYFDAKKRRQLVELSSTSFNYDSSENATNDDKLDFTKSELSLISKKAREGNINLWLASSNH